MYASMFIYWLTNWFMYNKPRVYTLKDYPNIRGPNNESKTKIKIY